MAVRPPTRSETNAYAIAEGKRLYTQLNCVGCHANGGGGMGPPLMDDKWIYGSAPANKIGTQCLWDCRRKAVLYAIELCGLPCQWRGWDGPAVDGRQVDLWQCARQ